jgi:predicted ArsR family transcriptional regulator
METHLESAAAAIGALEDQARRRMYLFIRDQGHPVSRDEAAREAGISRKLAAFHLDKLVERGLLKAHYARPSGRGGPGAGRPSKLYEPAEGEVSVSLPERRYDFVGRILVDAIASQSPEESSSEAARRVGREAGEALGRDLRRAGHLRPAGPERAVSAARGALRELGFEPNEGPRGELTLRNCPFHALAQRAPALVCGLNQAFVDGLLRGLGNDTVEAVLEPQPGQCCVKLRMPERR